MRSFAIAFLTLLFSAALSPIGCASSSAPPHGVDMDTFVPMPIDPSVPYPSAPGCEQSRPVPREAKLPVELISQHIELTKGGPSNLCWAAATAMVSTTLGNPRSTCYVASYQTIDGANCCRVSRQANPATIEACNRSLSKAAMATLFRNLGLHGLRVDMPLAEEALRHEIAQGRPVIMHIQEGGLAERGGRIVNMEHVMVIAGYGPNGFRVLDPDTSPEQTYAYAELLHGRGARRWEWNGTWYLFSFRRDGCNPAVNDRCACTSP